jgi:hypothetical protein
MSWKSLVHYGSVRVMQFPRVPMDWHVAHIVRH